MKAAFLERFLLPLGSLTCREHLSLPAVLRVCITLIKGPCEFSKFQDLPEISELYMSELCQVFFVVVVVCFLSLGSPTSRWNISVQSDFLGSSRLFLCFIKELKAAPNTHPLGGHNVNRQLQTTAPVSAQMCLDTNSSPKPLAKRWSATFGLSCSL